MTEDEALERLRRWAGGNGLNPDVVGGDGWSVKELAARGVWVITPAGRGNTTFIITPSEVRAVHPSRERFVDALDEVAPKPAG